MASRNSYSELANIRVAVIDLDGVVYRGKTMIEGADAAISKLRKYGLRVVFATNSSVRTRADIVEKLRILGIPTKEDEVLTSTYVTGLLIRSIGPNKNVLVIGTERLREDIGHAGAVVVPRPPCDFVVIGMDPDFSYEKIRLAMEGIADGAIFVACNRDANFPDENGRPLPGCGPMVAAVEAGVGLSPHYVAGKPNVLMLEIIAARFRVKSGEILVVGDSMESDIAMATAFGSPSVLVGPGASQLTAKAPLPSCITIRSLTELPGLFEGKGPFSKHR
jgi:HAD superfamily hydrolase (TIGR01450 family)